MNSIELAMQRVRISQLIAALIAAQLEHGDLYVLMGPSPGSTMTYLPPAALEYSPDIAGKHLYIVSTAGTTEHGRPGTQVTTLPLTCTSAP